MCGRGDCTKEGWRQGSRSLVTHSSADSGVCSVLEQPANGYFHRRDLDRACPRQWHTVFVSCIASVWNRDTRPKVGRLGRAHWTCVGPKCSSCKLPVTCLHLPARQFLSVCNLRL